MTIDIVSENQCYGCSACFNICPVRAIEMTRNEEGFVRPIIHEDVCIHCNKCEKVCPALHSENMKNKKTAQFWAVRNNNDNMVKKSSSGGIFALLAEYMLAQKGVVYGAAFDDENVLRHVRVDDFAKLEQLLGSKYVQSDIGTVYSQVRADLHDNKKVLFVGTPCQVAGLKAFLGKDDDNLLLVDLLCHGVPSPEVWRLYLQSLNVKGKAHIEFRNKDEGWKNYSIIIDDKVKDVHHDNPYNFGFLNNLYLRKSCYQCQFCGVKRCGDLTLGDFWGAGLFRKNLDADDKGTSVILLNSAKGYRVLEKIRTQLAFCERVPEFCVAQFNPSLSACVEHNPMREKFFEDFKVSKNWQALQADYLQYPYKSNRKVGILNLQDSSNFGACLVAFALQKMIEKLGAKAEIIDFRTLGKVSKRDKIRMALIKNDMPFEKFRRQFLKRTKSCYNFDDLCELNNHFDTFVVGSDQVWRYIYVAQHLKTFFLDFVDDDKLLLSYAASFGVDYWEGSDAVTEEVARYLRRFSAVSVREISGEKICKDIFNVDAVQVIDPTLLLAQEDYEQIILRGEHLYCPEEKYIAYMLLDENNEAFENLKQYALSQNLQLINIYKNELGEYRQVGDWLNLIKNAELVVTDSFHCVCFSLIFKKNFVCEVNPMRGISRLRSLLALLELDGNLVQHLDVHVWENIAIDYSKVEPLLKLQKEKAMRYLRDSLSLMPKRLKPLRKDKTLALFGKVILWRSVSKGNSYVGKLFNFLPIIKIVSSRYRKRCFLFGKIPLLTYLVCEK